jgi:hypothetical protein
MGSEEGRREKAEKILRLRALSALLLLVWTIAIPLVLFALYRRRGLRLRGGRDFVADLPGALPELFSRGWKETGVIPNEGRVARWE